MAPAPSRVHASAVLGAEEEGGAPRREVAPVEPDGGVAGGRRGVETVPGRVASRPPVVAGQRPGSSHDAAASVVAAQASLGRKAGRPEAAAAAARVPRIATTVRGSSGHPPQGLGARRARARQTLPPTSGVAMIPGISSAAVVLPPSTAAVVATTRVTATAGPWRSSAATAPGAPSVRQVILGHTPGLAGPSRVAVPLGPQGREGSHTSATEAAAPFPAKVLRPLERLLGPVRPRAAPVLACVPRPACSGRRRQTTGPSPSPEVRLSATNIAPVLLLARGVLELATEGVATGARLAIGAGQATSTEPWCARAKKEQARATLRLGATVVGPIQLLPRRLAERMRIAQVRNVRGDVEGR